MPSARGVAFRSQTGTPAVVRVLGSVGRRHVAVGIELGVLVGALLSPGVEDSVGVWGPG